MNEKIIDKLIKTNAFSRIYSQNMKAIKAAKHQAFIKSLEMLVKDYDALESKGDSNVKKSWTNPFNSPVNASGISQNDYSNSGTRGQSAGRSAKSSFKPASEKQVKYLRYLIYVLSQHYPDSNYNQIYKEVCHKNGIKALTTSCITRAKAYKLIQDLKSLLPSSKPKPNSSSKVSSSLPF